MEITGTIKNARRLARGEDIRAPNICGNIYGDTRGRFPDGMIVYTSTIMEELPGDIFVTRNSTYKVEFAA